MQKKSKNMRRKKVLLNTSNKKHLKAKNVKGVKTKLTRSKKPSTKKAIVVSKNKKGLSPKKNKTKTPVIDIINARENNLKNISLQIPRYSFAVVTGLSGSGKSSLVYDTIFKEGQRRYVASLSSYARQFIPLGEPADVDGVSGLSPTISITQKTSSRNPRSTVGTVTKVYDFLRLWYARLGALHCPEGHGEIKARSKDVLAKSILRDWKGKSILLMAPVVIERKGEYRKDLKNYSQQGFVRFFIDGKLYHSEDTIDMGRYQKHTIEIVIDRLVVSETNYPRMVEAIDTACQLTGGLFSLVGYQALKDNEKEKNRREKEKTKKKVTQCPQK